MDHIDDAVWGGQQSATKEATIVPSEDLELVEEPKHLCLDTDTDTIILPDDEAEIVVTAIGFGASPSGAGNFFLHGGDEVPVGPRVNFTNNVSDVLQTRLRMGMGNPCRCKVNLTAGNVKVYVEYFIRRYSGIRKPTTTEYFAA
jgi:hypothetical protein